MSRETCRLVWTLFGLLGDGDASPTYEPNSPVYTQPPRVECDEADSEAESDDETEEQGHVRRYVVRSTNSTVEPVVGRDAAFMGILTDATDAGRCGVVATSLGLPHLCSLTTAFGTHVLSSAQVGLGVFRVTTKVDHCVGYYHLTEPAFSGLVTTHGMKLMSVLIKRDPSCQHHDTFVAYIKFALSVVTYLDFVKLAFMVLESMTDLPVKYVDRKDAFLTCMTDAARATKCTLQERAEVTKVLLR